MIQPKISKLFLLFVFTTALTNCAKGDAAFMKPREELERLGHFSMDCETNNYEGIEKYLSEGGDPDVCVGPGGWNDGNPLWIVLNSTRDNKQTIDFLISCGADVTNRPYIWRIIDHHIITQEDLDWLEAERKEGRFPVLWETTADLMKEKIRILIEAGADVDAKGARNRMLFPSVDLVYRNYFKKEGSRPVNYAIERDYPEIVDFLLQYTLLDEESLSTAESKGDPAMIDKVKTILKEQEAAGKVYKAKK